MREIKFRAWNGGVMTFFKLGEHLNIEFINNPNNKVMQFTGLKDKNKKDIYEGDVLEIGGDKIRAVVYWNDKFAWWDLEDYEHSLGLLIETRRFVDIEVIGNIYENPELLTQNHRKEKGK